MCYENECGLLRVLQWTDPFHEEKTFNGSQVVSKQYRDLLAKNKQELFFGSRWHLQLLLGELGGEFYKLLGCSRLVAQFASGDDYQRQFREVCFANKLCVTARSNTLTFEECQPSSQQLLNGQDLGLLFLQDYKQRTNSEASYDSVVDTSQDLGVDEFTKQSLNVACETNQAVRKLSFGVGGLGAGDSGLSGSCTSTVLRGPRRDRGSSFGKLGAPNMDPKQEVSE